MTSTTRTIETKTCYFLKGTDTEVRRVRAKRMDPAELDVREVPACEVITSTITAITPVYRSERSETVAWLDIELEDGTVCRTRKDRTVNESDGRVSVFDVGSRIEITHDLSHPDFYSVRSVIS